MNETQTDKSQEDLDAAEDRVRLQRLVRRQLERAPIGAMEREAVTQALDAGQSHGYGNVIAWLMTEWAVILRDKWKLPEDTAIEAVSGRTPYPLPPNAESSNCAR